MAWIKPYRYWEIQSDPSRYAYQLKKYGPVYKIHDASQKPTSLKDEREIITVAEMVKLKAFRDYGVYDSINNNLPFVNVGVPLAWCIAKIRGLHILKDRLDRKVASMYQHCGL
jgi:hypothetical protein